MTDAEIASSLKICENASQPPNSLLLLTKRADQIFVEHAHTAFPAALASLVEARKARFRVAQIASEFAVRLNLPRNKEDEALLSEIAAVLGEEPTK